MSAIKQFLEALDKGKEYDFIANYYGEMTRFDLRTILLEYIYAVHCAGGEIESDIQNDVSGSLEEREIFDD